MQSVVLSELLELAVAEGSRLVVDLDSEARSLAAQQYGARLDLCSASASLRRAGFLAELASWKIERGELVGAASVEPIYMTS